MPVRLRQRSRLVVTSGCAAHTHFQPSVARGGFSVLSARLKPRCLQPSRASPVPDACGNVASSHSKSRGVFIRRHAVSVASIHHGTSELSSSRTRGSFVTPSTAPEGSCPPAPRSITRTATCPQGRPTRRNPRSSVRHRWRAGNYRVGGRPGARVDRDRLQRFPN